MEKQAQTVNPIRKAKLHYPGMVFLDQLDAISWLKKATDSGSKDQMRMWNDWIRRYDRKLFEERLPEAINQLEQSEAIVKSGVGIVDISDLMKELNF